MGVPNGSGRHELRRVLRLWDSVAVVVGIIVGSGIFFTPTTVAQHLDHTGLIFLVWLVGGLTAICGALTYAELAAAWPHTGGMYIFIRECFGPFAGFLFGWAQLVIIRPSIVAGISVITAQYVGHFLPTSQLGTKLIAVGGILVVSIVNYVGVRLSTVVQNVFTIIKILALLFIAFAGLFWFEVGHLFETEVLPASFDFSLIGALGIALIGVYWTFDGWSEITTVAGEVKNPGKNIPRALLLGSLSIIVLYLLVNASFIHVLSIEGVRNSERVAADAMIRVFGSKGGAIIAVAVIISTLGTLNGVMLTGPRIFFAMSVDRVFFSWGKTIDARFKTPSVAIATQAILAIPLVITWTFSQLATYFVFVSLIFYSLVTLAVFRLRRMPRAKDLTYRTWGYPVTPLIFLAVAVSILVNTVLSEEGIEQAVIGTLILAVGVPVYYIWIKRR